LVGNRLSSSPYILHLYQQYGCINEADEDALTIAEDEVVYKLGPEVELTETGSKESSEDHVAPEPPLPDPIPIPAPAPAPAPETRNTATPRPREEGAPTKEQPWRNINPATWEPPEAPSKRVRAELTNPQNEYWMLEHITRGVSKAMGNCTAKNILRELARKTDRLVKAGRARDGEGAAWCTGGNNDMGAHPEKRGDPEVPSGANCGAEPSPGVGGSSGRGCQQGLPLRPAGGVSGSGICPADSPNSGKVLPHHEEFI
jgi:hypothetical protein